MVLNYFNPVWENGLTYSVDMVRLDVRADLETGQKWFNLLSNKEDYFGKIEYYQSFKMYQYRHLITVKLDDCDSSITMGFQLNSEKKHESFKGFIEFNPNKVGCSKFYEWLLIQLKIQFKEVNVNRWDLAIDIPIERSRVFMRKDNRLYSKLESQNGITEYLGRRSHDGFVKLYDKTKESNLDIKQTRFEITISGLKEFDSLNIPEVTIINEFSNMNDLNTTDKVLVELIKLNGGIEEYLRKLGRRKSEKLRPYLVQTDKALCIEKNIYDELINQLKLYQINYIK